MLDPPSSAQQERFKTRKKLHSNADMGAKEMQKPCALKPEAQEVLRLAISDLHFSARVYDRILKVSRTISALEGSDENLPQYINEAIQYRTLDRQLWA